MTDSGLTMNPGQLIKPKFDEKMAIELVRRLYGFTVNNINELNAYDDKNYHIICDGVHANPHVSRVHEHGYVLKILNSLDSRNVEFVEAQNAMMLHLHERGIRCTLPVRNVRGSYCSLEKPHAGADDGEHVVRLLVYQPGVTLHSVALTASLLRDVGRFAASLDTILETFTHPAYLTRTSLWTLDSIPRLRDFAYAVNDNDDRGIVNAVIGEFEDRVLANANELERGIIHGDLNEQNLLVDADATRIVAVIDFGDSHRGCYLYECAIAVCYMIVQSRDPTSAKHVLEGFRSVRALTRKEIGLMKICVCARLAQSLVLGAYSHSKDPQNQYLLVTQKPGWEILRKLWPIDEVQVLRLWGLADDAPDGRTTVEGADVPR